MAPPPASRPAAAPLWLEAAWTGLRGRVLREWQATPLHAATLGRPRASALSTRPRDLRPVDPALGAAVRAGRFPFTGAELDIGPGGDPWDRASPSRALAVQLHRFAWLPSLLASGVDGGSEALRLFLAWRALFDRPSGFAWSAEVLERRVYNLACGASALAAAASDREAEGLAQALARQARHLLALDAGPARRAERLTAAAVAGCALEGRAGERLLAAALPRLPDAVSEAVLADGGLRTRSPEQGLELWFDLATLDDALSQRGRETPDAISRAMDRLAGATRFFTLADGRLAAFNGGGPSTLARVGAARSADAPAETSPYAAAPHAGYQRLEGASLSVLVDAGAPPPGGWSVAACAQPLALEVAADGERLIASAGWTPDAAAPSELRLGPSGSTATPDDETPGAPLRGLAGRALGPRLAGGATRVEAAREGAEAGVWLQMSHDGFARLGLTHERRLYLDPLHDELRGEDRLTPLVARTGPAPTLIARFHLPPEVRASVARDGRSVLLRGRSNRGWWFRNDAPEVRLEPSAVVEGGAVRPASQIVLVAAPSPDGARVRWKLAPIDPPPPRSPGAPAAALADPAPLAAPTTGPNL